MSDKVVISVGGLGCLALLAIIAVTIGSFIGVIIAVAKWIAS